MNKPNVCICSSLVAFGYSQKLPRALKLEFNTTPLLSNVRNHPISQSVQVNQPQQVFSSKLLREQYGNSIASCGLDKNNLHGGCHSDEAIPEWRSVLE